MASEALLRSLRAAVEAAPDDVSLRVHLAELLAAAGEHDEAVRHAAAALQREPGNAAALALVAQSHAARDAVDGSPSSPVDPADTPEGSEVSPPEPTEAEALRRLDSELAGIAPPMYVEGEPEPATDGYDIEPAQVRLADVAGMAAVKERLEAAVLAPMRHPELGRLYGKSLRGGLLLYGPPGCGKTFIARALAGEIDARFMAVSLADVLDMFIGQSERNLRELFQIARRNAPCVLFLDEVDALGQKRSHLRHSAARGTVNQLLAEMDGIASEEGVYVLGATNHPWDVDVALRRPGRFDRMLLVLPPDEPAREAILRYHLRDRPIAGVDASRLAKLTDGYSGADLAHICETAAEHALLDSARKGAVRMIGMADLERAAREVRPSIGPWLEVARNVAQFANEGGAYDDLLTYLRQRRLL
jgi:SpoVK/Ycf46/Vps4 family AAA+-type ATPase